MLTTAADGDEPLVLRRLRRIVSIPYDRPAHGRSIGAQGASMAQSTADGNEDLIGRYKGLIRPASIPVQIASQAYC